MLQKDFSLKKYNTFGIEVKASSFIKISSLDQLKRVILNNNGQDFFVLGAGSNLLFTKDVDKCVICIENKGVTIEKEENNYVWVNVQAGELWHDFVLWAVNKNYGGLENLSLIPGKVGAAPIQNIGAYGVEVKECITKVKAIEIKTGNLISISNKDCKFSYRDSIFKNKLNGFCVIYEVQFRLTKKKHMFKISYGNIRDVLKCKELNIRDISNAVIKIRESKLPDPAKLGNSGSFFKNPVVSKDFFSNLKEQYPSIEYYNTGQHTYKISAGWLIEKQGFKGFRIGDTGVHSKQALVLVNYGKASGVSIYNLAKEIQNKTMKKFGIYLELEVNVI